MVTDILQGPIPLAAFTPRVPRQFSIEGDYETIKAFLRELRRLVDVDYEGEYPLENGAAGIGTEVVYYDKEPIRCNKP